MYKAKKSYSQSGEDMIIDFLFQAKGISKPSYIDIGAHDPLYLSNTAFFYKNGSRGINIEPNPQLFKKIEYYRKKDINLNIGIAQSEGFLEYYMFNVPTMNTFSKEIADDLIKKYDFKKTEIKRIEVKNLRDIVNRYRKGVFPDFLSLDTEGFDLEILKSIDYSNSYPKVICVETIEYSSGFNGRKEDEIIDFLIDKGYKVYADTYINTIFTKFER